MPETVFIDDIVSIPVRYAVKEIADGKVDIVVKLGDRVVATKHDIPVKAGDDETLTFVPTKQDAEARSRKSP